MGSMKIRFFTIYIFFSSLAISNLNIPKYCFSFENNLYLLCVFPVQICI